MLLHLEIIKVAVLAQHHSSVARAKFHRSSCVKQICSHINISDACNHQQAAGMELLTVLAPETGLTSLVHLISSSVVTGCPVVAVLVHSVHVAISPSILHAHGSITCTLSRNIAERRSLWTTLTLFSCGCAEV
jgi:hypothetical protein